MNRELLIRLSLVLVGFVLGMCVIGLIAQTKMNDMHNRWHNYADTAEEHARRDISDAAFKARMRLLKLANDGR